MVRGEVLEEARLKQPATAIEPQDTSRCVFTLCRNYCYRPRLMTPAPEDPSAQTQLYELHFPRMVAMATSELHLPEREAVPLVHKLLLAHLFRPNLPADVESWLNGALRTAVQRLAEEVRS